jgi:hypothetical protein
LPKNSVIKWLLTTEVEMDNATRGGLLGDYFAENELAAELDVTVRTVQRWRADREGPPATFIGSRPVYNKASARAWLKSRERNARSRRLAAREPTPP